MKQKSENSPVLKPDKLFLFVILITAVLFALFFSLVPFAYDDYYWASPHGDELLRSFFANYNGRYLGNLTVYCMVRSKVFRVIIMTVMSVALCFEISYYASKGKNQELYYISCILLFSASIFLAYIHPKANIFSETIAWQAGFANYVMPMPFVMIFIVVADKYYQNPKRSAKKAEYILMFVSGFVACLFLETITLFCAMLSVLTLFYFYILKKEKHPSLIAGFGGVLLGAVAMFSNSSYLNILKGKYKTAPRSVGFLDIQLSLSKISGKLLVAVVAAVIVALAFFVVFPLLITKNKSDRLRLYSFLIFIFLVLLPMFFINGKKDYLFTVRLYFPHYVFAVTYILTAVEIILRNKKVKTVHAVEAAVSIITVCVIVFIGGVYSNIHQIETARDKYVEQQISENKDIIEVIAYPKEYEKFIFCGNQYLYGATFKEYFHLDRDVKGRYIEYKDYKQQNLKSNSGFVKNKNGLL